MAARRDRVCGPDYVPAPDVRRGRSYPLPVNLAVPVRRLLHDLRRLRLRHGTVMPSPELRIDGRSAVIWFPEVDSLDRVAVAHPYLLFRALHERYGLPMPEGLGPVYGLPDLAGLLEAVKDV